VLNNEILEQIPGEEFTHRFESFNPNKPYIIISQECTKHNYKNTTKDRKYNWIEVLNALISSNANFHNFHKEKSSLKI